MKIIKNTYIERKILENIQRVERITLMRCVTNIYKDIKELQFEGSNFTYIYDFKERLGYAIVKNQDDLKYIESMFKEERILNCFKDLQIYYDWLNCKYNHNSGNARASVII